MILAVSLNPTVDRTLFVDELKVGDTNRVVRTETDAGGKGINLARVAAELGAEAHVIAFLGGGPGEFVRRVLMTEGVSLTAIETEEETRINVCIESPQSGPPTMLNERGPTVSSENWSQMLELVKPLAARATWVAIGGSIPPGAPPDSMKTLIEIAHNQRAKALLDADGAPFVLGMEAGPEMIKPNVLEAERYLGRELRTDAQAFAAVRDLADRGPQYVVLSRGELGAILACDDGVFDARSPRIRQASTIGSGDSLLGAMLAALEQGKDTQEALRWGVAAGAATAMTNGASIASLAQVEALLPAVSIQRQS